MFIVIAAAISSFAVCLEPDESLELFHNKYAIANLNAGITSDNYGLKQQSIYFAGLYKVKKSFEPLAKVLKEETDENIAKLTILALFRIDEKKAIEFLKDYASDCKNPELKKFCKIIDSDFASNYGR